MRLDELDAAIGAMRATDGDDPGIAEATQLRVRRSLEARARSRHQLVGIITTIAILLVGTVSWALATGRVAALWSPVVPPREVAPPPPAPPRPPPHRALTTGPVPALPPETVPPPPATASEPAPVAPPRAVPVQHPRAAAPPVEVLYRSAHSLHFHGGEPAATLAAWDAYLAAEPGGRFAVEARYNRALTLVRLGRYTEARLALMPFARGDVDPEGYRQREAEQLIERLAHAE